MKILHLTTLPYGGAGIACVRLHHALRTSGISSKVLSVLAPMHPEEGVFSLEEMDGEFDVVKKRAERKRYIQAWKLRLYGKTKELFMFPDSHWKIEEHPLVREADVIHLHWVAGMIDVTRFFASVTKPIVWTLHDAWPFSGGFHYEQYWNAMRFQSVSEKNLAVKRSAYSGHQFSIVSPSEYLLDLGKKSQVFAQAIYYHIPYSIPSEIFHLREDRGATRKKYGIGDDQLMWIFGSDELDYFRKGADILFDAFTHWKNDRVRLVIAGEQGKQQIPNDARIQFTGHIREQSTMSTLLGAADALIHTSREDNFPNIILEAFFCGTPVLATRAGGVPEMITTANGFLTKDFTPESLRNGFDVLLNAQFNREEISRSAQGKYASAVQAGKMIEVYKAI